METNVLPLFKAATAKPVQTRLARISLALANEQDREKIYRIRHAIYARELGQHAVNETGRLTDCLDGCNYYLVAKADGEIAGFVSITPPNAPSFSIDTYIARQ